MNNETNETVTLVDGTVVELIPPCYLAVADNRKWLKRPSGRAIYDTLRTLQHRVRELEDWLITLGGHADGCPVWTDGVCDCGWSEAEASLPAPPVTEPERVGGASEAKPITDAYRNAIYATAPRLFGRNGVNEYCKHLGKSISTLTQPEAEAAIAELNRVGQKSFGAEWREVDPNRPETILYFAG